MFNAFFPEETGHSSQAGDEAGPSTSNAEASSSGAANPLLNLWSVATAVKNTVKARADELVKSVVDTDWRSELSQFSKEVGEESKSLKEKTAELVEHLPEQVVHLPEKAEEALHHLPVGQVQLPKDVGQTLEGVSTVLSQFGKSLLLGTKELIDELKDGVETEIAAASREGKRAGRSSKVAGAGSASKLSAAQANRYSRFEAEVAAMQRDSSTYCDEPEDGEDYGRWRAGFNLGAEAVRAEIGRITSENAFMAELQSRLVPIIVEHGDFWGRYFYRLQKLQQKEEQRQQLAQRAKTLQEDEVPLGWGDEDEAPPAASSGVEAAPSPSSSPTLQAQEAAAPAAQEPSSPATLPVAAGVTEGSAPAAAEAAASPTAASPTGDEGNPPASPAGAAAESPAAATTAAESLAAAACVPAAASSSSAGGASELRSATTSPHVDVDPHQVESEPHAETASDSSAREWCVVSSGARPSSGGGAGAGAATAVAAPAAGSPTRLQPQPEGTSVEVVVEGSEAAKEQVPAAEAAAPADEEQGSPAGAASVGASSPAKSGDKVAAKPPTSQGAKSGGKAGAEDDVDEDWGNWD